jgi:hypothetical protein
MCGCQLLGGNLLFPFLHPHSKSFHYCHLKRFINLWQLDLHSLIGSKHGGMANFFIGSRTNGRSEINSCKIIPHCYNSRFALHMHTFMHSLLFPWFSTYLTLWFIKTPYSWLFHITKICTSQYVVKNSRNRITIHFIILILQKIHTTI